MDHEIIQELYKSSHHTILSHINGFQVTGYHWVFLVFEINNYVISRCYTNSYSFTFTRGNAFS